MGVAKSRVTPAPRGRPPSQSPPSGELTPSPLHPFPAEPLPLPMSCGLWQLAEKGVQRRRVRRGGRAEPTLNPSYCLPAGASEAISMDAAGRREQLQAPGPVHLGVVRRSGGQETSPGAQGTGLPLPRQPVSGPALFGPGQLQK